MLIFLTIGMCVLYDVTQIICKENIYRPSLLFSLVWALVLTLYSFKLFDLPTINDGTILIICSGICAFFIGSFLSKNCHKRIVIANHELFNKTIKEYALIPMIVVFFMIMIIPVMRSIVLLISGSSLYTIRYSLQNDILGTGVITILFNYYCEPFLTFYTVYSVANLFSSNRKIRNLIISIVAIIFMTIVSGGRFFIFYLIGALGVCFMIYRKNIDYKRIQENKKILKIAKLLITIATIIIVIITINRGSEIGETIYVYLCGGVPFLEHIIELFNQRTNGAATLYGFLRPIFVIFRKVGICGFPTWLENIEKIFLSIDNPYYLAPGILFNSFSTSFFAPYLDGGIIGLSIFYLFLGFFCESVYKRLDITNEYSVSWFLLISLIIILSFFRLTITHYSFSLAFVYLIITHKYIEINQK